ncbi:HelD family protein [Cryptosporangium aurantiacum]|uniref:DNA helicase IV n=1 Tax=Cryptosporangium aurantiacum TaxID=134849 RepID=A0A1M7RMI5_9ACTN|nr:UvrD-helicase domain-containing protein [Cryptosporangium aurantiacum]SHN47545.1 DNA helicase IV [Cryptosporangium aurantiacum]
MIDRPSVLTTEIAAEQRHVDAVYARLEELRSGAGEVEAEGHRRAQLGNEGALYERDVLVHQAARRLKALDSGYDGLVFGRLDLHSGEARHIGRLGVLDATYEPLVVDWRAPAAAPFYRATAEDPLGVIRRRVIHSSGTRVVGLSDDLLDPSAAPEGMAVVGEGALMATLARARGRAMRDIVSTIQREQDVAIRAPASGTTIIEGGPGTGKTAVALHRVAYLLYSDRNRYAGGGVLVVGPSPTFVRYIDQVLPSLGEEGVVLRSLATMLTGIEATRRDNAALSAIKGALRMRRVLSRLVWLPVPTAPTRFRTVYGGEVLTLDAAALAAARKAARRRGSTPNSSRGQATTAVLDALWNVSRSWAEPPEHWERAEFDAELRDRSEFREFLAAWWPIVDAERVLRWAADRSRLARSAGSDLRRDEVPLVAASFARAGWSVADVALLDELRALLGKPPKPQGRRRRPEEWEMQEIRLSSDRASARTQVPDDEDDEFSLIVVDEAQDLSPMQWRMLGRRGKYASWTLVGDPAQSAWEDPDEAATAMDAAVGTRVRRRFMLTTNYRNSAEIFELAASVLRRWEPGLDLPTAVRRTGAEPEQRVVSDDRLQDELRAAVVELLADVEGTVGVVTTADERDDVAGRLSGLGAGRLQVVDSIEAKGLEYDGVVVVQPAGIIAESSAGHRVLYVSLSRATHRLVVVTTSADWAEPPADRPDPDRLAEPLSLF